MRMCYMSTICFEIMTKQKSINICIRTAGETLIKYYTDNSESIKQKQISNLEDTKNSIPDYNPALGMELIQSSRAFGISTLIIHP